MAKEHEEAARTRAITSLVNDALSSLAFWLRKGYKLDDEQRSTLGLIVSEAMRDRSIPDDNAGVPTLQEALSVAISGLTPLAGSDIEVMGLIAKCTSLLGGLIPGAVVSGGIRWQINLALRQAQDMLARHKGGGA